MTPQSALTRLIEKREIAHDEMLLVMRQIMTGELTPAQIAAIVMGLRIKGETINEIAAAAQVMRELSTKVVIKDDKHLVDTCGTGGDGIHTFNISTTSAFVAAAAGAKVAKHGGRSVSSTCGSADVLESLGANLNMPSEKIADAIEKIGVGFMFAPNHHSAMKHAAPVRKELGVRTMFNILGPLTNPANAKNQLMGVFDKALVSTQAHVLKVLGSRHVMVVHGADGMDEISIAGDTHVAELNNGEISEYIVNPKQFGLKTSSNHDLRVSNKDEAKNMMLEALHNEPGAARDIVILNAGAVIYVSGLTKDLQAGIEKAKQALIDGSAKNKLQQFIDFSQKI